MNKKAFLLIGVLLATAAFVHADECDPSPITALANGWKLTKGASPHSENNEKYALKVTEKTTYPLTSNGQPPELITCNYTDENNPNQTVAVSKAFKAVTTTKEWSEETAATQGRNSSMRALSSNVRNISPRTEGSEYYDAKKEAKKTICRNSSSNCSFSVEE